MSEPILYRANFGDGTHTKGYPDHRDALWPANIIEQMADFCAAQNPRFNRERWLSYAKELSREKR